MKPCTIIKIFSVFFFILSYKQLNSQVLLHDDFQFKSNHWYWRSDGNQEIPSVNNGLLKLELKNANSSEYCNTEIYNRSKLSNKGTEPYSVGTQVKMRLKCSPQHIGSRGWGFWDGDLDLFSMLFDFDVAWIMQQESNLPGDQYNWFYFGVDGNYLSNRKTFNLQNIVNENQWHTYKIVWTQENVSLYIDDQLFFQSFENLPDDTMRVDLWIDNRVINLQNPVEFWNNDSEGSSMIIDFIEVSGLEGPSISRSYSGNIKLWDSPNTYGSGKPFTLFKTYNFNSTFSGNGFIFITGNAESYGGLENDDDLRIRFNNTDFGWDSNYSLNGSELNGNSKSITLPVSVQAGENSLELHTDITPFVKDVLFLFSENGQIIFNDFFNETARGVDGLWKTIDFELDHSTEVTFLISGSGMAGDKIRIIIDDDDYSWEGEYSIDGNILMGFPKTVVINKILKVGSHEIKIYKIGSPTLLNISGYGTNIFYLDTKVFLESCYENNTMNSDIAYLNDFPKNQPFNTSPWNYQGREALETIPSGVIDWVLINLESSSSTLNGNYYRAVLLKSDGHIMDLDGNHVKFLGVPQGQYRLHIYHRNHLSILSSQTITVN